MKIIKEISDQIKDELYDAEKYIDFAIQLKQAYPQVADMLATTSSEEVKHIYMLHSEVVRLITAYRKENGDPPKGMLEAYDVIHMEMIDHMNNIKTKQEIYKSV